MKSQTTQTHWVLSLSLAALVGASWACGTPSRPTPPASPIPVSTEAAGEVRHKAATAVADALDGTVTLEITEAQLTSYAAIELAKQPDAPIQDVQIYLRDGKAQIFGTVLAGGVSVPAVLITSFTVTEQNTVKVTIESADFGPVPVPNTMLAEISAQFNQLVNEQVTAGQDSVKITDLKITEGQLTLTGLLVAP